MDLSEVDFAGLALELSVQLRIAGLLTHIKRDGENLIFATSTNIKNCLGHAHIEIIGENYENNRRCTLRMIALSWKWTAMLFPERSPVFLNLQGELLQKSFPSSILPHL